VRRRAHPENVSRAIVGDTRSFIFISMGNADSYTCPRELAADSSRNRPA
jgi:hypothetical protein